MTNFSIFNSNWNIALNLTIFSVQPFMIVLIPFMLPTCSHNPPQIRNSFLQMFDLFVTVIKLHLQVVYNLTLSVSLIGQLFDFMTLSLLCSFVYPYIMLYFFIEVFFGFYCMFVTDLSPSFLILCTELVQSAYSFTLLKF